MQKKTIKFKVCLLGILGAGIFWLGGAVPTQAASNYELQVTQVYQQILSRNPRTDEVAFWSSHFPGQARLIEILNQVPERKLAIHQLYQRALKRNAQTYELEALLRWRAPANRILENLFSSAERKLAIEDAYWGILGRRPLASELDFYYVTRSPFDKIKQVLSQSYEREIKIREVFQSEFCRSATNQEIQNIKDSQQYLYPLRQALRANAIYSSCVNTQPVVSPTATQSLLLGIVHFNYYGNLGGNSGSNFYADQAWLADNIDLAIIGWGDSGMEAAWQALKADQPAGNWLKWRLAQVFNTYESAGSCEAPVPGGQDQSYQYQQAEFNEFLQVYPQYGDGESCFLHAQNSGNLTANWHTHGCVVDLSVQAGERLESLIWDEYGYLIDISSACAKDFISWRTIKDIQVEGYGGVGFDNLGSLLQDGYYYPLGSSAKIAEIDDAIEGDPTAFNNWWYENIEDLLEYVAAKVYAVAPEAKIVYNGASYCSWDGGVEPLKNIAGPNLGVWCEDALQYPEWGWYDESERLETLIDLSQSVNAEQGFTVLESFFQAGSAMPSAPEVMYYLAAYYIYKNGQDVLALKPDWDPYQVLQNTVWFNIFARNIGQATEAPINHGQGIFSRPYSNDGQDYLVLVRVDGSASNLVDFSLQGQYQILTADNQAGAVVSSLSFANGQGYILRQI